MNAYLEAIVTLSVRGPTGQARGIEAVIDTGYSGFLTLPPSLVEELALPFRFRGRAFLANGSEETFAVHGVTALWDGHLRYIEADAVGPTPLVGMALLGRHDLNIEVESGGRIIIQARA